MARTLGRTNRSTSDREDASEVELESLTGKPRNDVTELVALASHATRNDFVRKVYGILTVQLIATTLITGTFVQYGHHWLKSNPQALMSAVSFSMAMTLAVSCICSCYPDLMRQVPLNYVLLATFTTAESTMLGFACLRYTAGSVLMCLGLTAFIVFGLTLYAMRTDNDMTTLGPYLFTALLVLFGGSMLMWFVASLGLHSTPLFGAVQFMYAILSAIVFSVFIVYDTQKILGGNHEHEFSVDDYAMAAMCIYLDIVQLFLALLQILGRQQDGDGL